MTEVSMPYDHGAGVTPMQVFEQSPHGSLLFSRACVVGLTAGIKSPFVADADGVGIVMMPFYEAVGARSFRHDGSRNGSRCQTYNVGLCGAMNRSERPTTAGRASLPNNE